MVLNYQLGVKYMDTIQTSLIHCYQVDMLDLGLNVNSVANSCFCISEFVYRNWCWRHESGSQTSSMMSQWRGCH